MAQARVVLKVASDSDPVAGDPTTRRRRRPTRRRPQPALTLSEWLPYWVNELGARNVRPATVANQRKALRKLGTFTGDVDPATVSTGDLDRWRDHMLTVEGLKPTSVNRYLLTVGTFFNWLTAERVLGEAPQPALLRVREVEAPPVFDAEVLGRLAHGAATVTRGRSAFEAARDVTMFALLQDTGLRASECAGLLLEHLNLPARQAFVHAEVAKGGFPRVVTFGFQTARLLNRYLRERESHAFAFLPQVFLGRKGPATYAVIHSAVRRAGLRAGIIGARPHLFRHTWAHDLKAQGVDAEVLMSLGGWRTPTMPLRYGRAERDRRALDAYQRLGSPVDRAAARSRRA